MILVHHLSGSKVNQIEQFATEEKHEFVFGRDPEADVVYDASRDDMVSRRHAMIRVTQGERPRYVLSDLGSSNGTFVNGTKITGEQDLMPGDVVSFGANGPKFNFDLQPRPAYLVAATRVIQRPVTTVLPTATSVIDTGAGAAPPMPTKVGVGHETVQRLLSDQRRASSRTGLYALAGVLVVVGLGGGLLYKVISGNHRQEAELLRQEAERHRVEAERLAAEQVANDKKLHDEIAKNVVKPVVTPEEIAHKYGNSTVEVYMEWRAQDKQSGKAVFQKYLNVKDKGKLPCYIQLPNGDVVRWLTVDDYEHINTVIGGIGSGTGFVTSSNGFIFTNKHVAAGWKVSYSAFSPELDYGYGILVKFGEKISVDVVDLNRNAAVRKAISDWIPDDGALIFDDQKPKFLYGSKSIITGENVELNVHFPGNTTGIEARLVSVSSDADAAAIKIETGQNLTPIVMANSDQVRIGQRVTVLGFPAFSSKIAAISTSVENGRAKQRIVEVPEPTVTEGLISMMSPKKEVVGDITTLGLMGDTYQLTVPSSHGNSGGPVFDTDGKVIGLFTYGTSRETTTYAVPVHYARDLMQMQRDN